MISLKRNNKLELIKATGLRSRKSSIYIPNQTEEFKISRGKFNDFLLCPRCFYLDRVKGIVAPDLPGWILNDTTDILLKKEFDISREEQLPHRIFKKNNLNDLVSFSHPDMDKWRDSLHHGLIIKFKNIILTGGIDNIWQNTKIKELIIVDYKSQASTKPVETESYLKLTYHEGYKIQMDFYAYLLKRMNFSVSNVSYFLVCNAIRTLEGFFGEMKFSETLIPYEWNDSWITQKLDEMLIVLNSDSLPEGNKSCMNCAYSRQRANYDKT